MHLAMCGKTLLAIAGAMPTGHLQLPLLAVALLLPLQLLLLHLLQEQLLQPPLQWLPLPK
jgi:hypothetical protein